MNKFYLWGLVAALAVMVNPVKGKDIGKLQPVSLLQVYLENGNVVLETDTGDIGRGMKLTEALENLQQTTSAEIFLETADFLLLTEETKCLLKELSGVLRPGTETFLIDAPVDGEAAARYLENHSMGSTIQKLQSYNREMPRLKTFGERFRLEV